MARTESGWRILARRLMTLFIIFLTILIIVVAGSIIAYRQMGLRVCQVQGVSMVPTIADKTTLLLHPGKPIERFDIVVFKEGGRYVLKRMVGLPGDDVTVMDGKLFINGELYPEPYLHADYCQTFDDHDFKVHVPEGEYFALGDNRDGSFDSRNAGTVQKDQIVGTAILRLPFLDGE